MTLTQATNAPTPVLPTPATLNGGRRQSDARTTIASDDFGGQVQRDALVRDAAPEWLLVKLYADLVDDLEKVRIATENRHRALVQAKGLEGSPEEIRLLGMVDSLKKIERAAIRDLERAVTAHPVGGFVEQNVGVGLKTMGRLLGLVGDPAYYIDSQTGEMVPRTVSKLWAYCGYRPGQGKRQGQDHEYNHEAKMRTYIIAECCMKNRNSAYRPVYEQARAKYEERDLPDWRKHAMALRVVAKEILKDLWKFRRDQMCRDPHLSGVAPDEHGRNGHDTHTENAMPDVEQGQVVGVTQN